MYPCADVLMCQCADVPMCQCANPPMCRCPYGPMSQSADVQLPYGIKPFFKGESLILRNIKLDKIETVIEQI
jgi:hypothetical protein